VSIRKPFPLAGRFAPYQGMTLLETVMAMTMIVVFTGVVAMVMQLTFRFMAAVEPKDSENPVRSNGVLIDHAEIHTVMDRLVAVLSQPGISDAVLEAQGPIAFALGTAPKQACVMGVPDQVSGRHRFELASRWQLPFPLEVFLPPGYRLCLWRQPVQEGPRVNARSVYVLQALPEQLSALTLPTRRLFCRPRHFCDSHPPQI